MDTSQRAALYQKTLRLVEACSTKLKESSDAVDNQLITAIVKAVQIGGSSGQDVLCKLRNTLKPYSQCEDSTREQRLPFIFLRNSIAHLQRNWEFIGGGALADAAAYVIDIQIGLASCRNFSAPGSVGISTGLVKLLDVNSTNALSKLKAAVRLSILTSNGLFVSQERQYIPEVVKGSLEALGKGEKAINSWYRREICKELCLYGEHGPKEKRDRCEVYTRALRIYTRKNEILQQMQTLLEQGHWECASELCSLVIAFSDVSDITEDILMGYRPIGMLTAALKQGQPLAYTFSYNFARLLLEFTPDNSCSNKTGNCLSLLWRTLTSMRRGTERSECPGRIVQWLLALVLKKNGQKVLSWARSEDALSAAAACLRIGSRDIIKLRNTTSDEGVDYWMDQTAQQAYFVLCDYSRFCEREDQCRTLLLEMLSTATSEPLHMLNVLLSSQQLKEQCILTTESGGCESAEMYLRHIASSPTSFPGMRSLLEMEGKISEIITRLRDGEAVLLWRKWIITLAFHWSRLKESDQDLLDRFQSMLTRLPSWIASRFEDKCDRVCTVLFCLAATLSPKEVYRQYTGVELTSPVYGKFELDDTWLEILLGVLQEVRYENIATNGNKRKRKGKLSNNFRYYVKTLEEVWGIALSNGIALGGRRELEEEDPNTDSDHIEDLPFEEFWSASIAAICHVLGTGLQQGSLRLFPWLSTLRKRAALLYLYQDCKDTNNIATVLEAEASKLECRTSTLRWEYLLESGPLETVIERNVSVKSLPNIKRLLDNPPLDWAFCGLLLDDEYGRLVEITSQAVEGVNVEFRDIDLATLYGKQDSLFEIINSADRQIKETSKAMKSKENQNADTREEKERWWQKRSDFDAELGRVISELEKYTISDINVSPAHTTHLSVDELRQRLKSLGLPTSGRKPDLVERLSDKQRKKGEPTTLLFLSDELQTFPWESMNRFKQLPTCRLLMFSLLSELFSSPEQTTQIDKDLYSGSYLVNPDGDSSKTEATFRDFLKARKELGNWTGMFGPPDPVDELLQRMSVSDVFLYCGHGAGERFIDRNRLQTLSSQAPVALLMGCSSARLIRVVESTARLWNRLDLKRPVLNYISAKFPAVVGNLWDVTDRDIDKFAKGLLENWFDSEDNLEQALQKARSRCKMKYLNGAAPICFAVPVRKKPHEQVVEGI
eukprot:gb/GECG01009145.1/.p1 GENE.gb/GECG01009145.1/~~gb/GECG01009145.1/.p1  ORF type:complete len:1176 (+),score=124.07 gb/GECG01009145.1/:1-3528(+)